MVYYPVCLQWLLGLARLFTECRHWSGTAWVVQWKCPGHFLGISGILVKQFSDNKPYFICLDKLNKNNPPHKFVKIQIQNNKNINNLCT